MSEMVLKNAFFSIGTTAAPTALTSKVKSVNIVYSAEMLDKTAMGSSGRRRIAGLKDAKVTVEFNQDFAASQVDATLFPLIGSTAKRIVIRPTTAVVGTGNPRFYGNFLLDSYGPVAGSVGALHTVSASFTGDGVLTRSTATT